MNVLIILSMSLLIMVLPMPLTLFRMVVANVPTLVTKFTRKLTPPQCSLRVTFVMVVSVVLMVNVAVTVWLMPTFTRCEALVLRSAVRTVWFTWAPPMNYYSNAA